MVNGHKSQFNMIVLYPNKKPDSIMNLHKRLKYRKFQMVFPLPLATARWHAQTMTSKYAFRRSFLFWGTLSPTISCDQFYCCAILIFTHKWLCNVKWLRLVEFRRIKCWSNKTQVTVCGGARIKEWFVGRDSCQTIFTLDSRVLSLYCVQMAKTRSPHHQHFGPKSLAMYVNEGASRRDRHADVC